MTVRRACFAIQQPVVFRTSAINHRALVASSLRSAKAAALTVVVTTCAGLHRQRPLPHQPGDALATDANALGRKLGMDARGSVGAREA
jgi:hypothetical protein